MMRILGILMLSVFFAAGGFAIGELFKQRYKDTKFLLSLCTHLSREISFSGKTLESCFSSYPHQKRAECLSFFQKRQFEHAFKGLHIERSLKEELLFFFQALGSGDKEQEEQRCRKTITLLEQEESKLCSGIKEQVRVARTVGVCIGGVLLLLLL